MNANRFRTLDILLADCSGMALCESNSHASAPGERLPSPTGDTLPSNRELLLDWFLKNHVQLTAWVGDSETHAHLMIMDPLAAIREAGLQIGDELIPELKSVAREIANVLKDS